MQLEKILYSSKRSFTVAMKPFRSIVKSKVIQFYFIIITTERKKQHEENLVYL